MVEKGILEIIAEYFPEMIKEILSFKKRQVGLKKNVKLQNITAKEKL